jgi:phenylacetyl-CoA:acceptor oxidoreductase 27-kDa subunit
MTRWAMVADLDRCVGCQTCTAACRHARKVLDVEAGTYPAVSRTFVPVGCQHCADPPCMHVCPTGATASARMASSRSTTTCASAVPIATSPVPTRLAS